MSPYESITNVLFVDEKDSSAKALDLMNPMHNVKKLFHSLALSLRVRLPARDTIAVVVLDPSDDVVIAERNVENWPELLFLTLVAMLFCLKAGEDFSEKSGRFVGEEGPC
jgi:hypothetical protein